MECAINWVLCDAEPLSQHMAASVGCKVWAPQRVPTATQNGSKPSAVTTPPPTSCCSHGLSIYFLLTVFTRRPRPPLGRTWKALTQMYHVNLYVNSMVMCWRCYRCWCCLPSTVRSLLKSVRDATRAAAPRACVQPEMPKTRNICLKFPSISSPQMLVR